MNAEEPFLELQFPIMGRTMPADHGYVLFSAICTLLPELRIEDEAIPHLAILPANGRLVGNRRLALEDNSRLIFRLPAGSIPKLIALAGKSLPIPGNGSLVLGAPSIQNLVPAPHLYARLVTIKVRDFKETVPDYALHFLKAARRMATAAGVDPGCLSLVKRRMPVSVEGKSGARGSEPWLRRTLSVRRKTIAGYAMVATDLTPDASLALQRLGIGGRRHFGCGVFVPCPHHIES